MFRTLLKSKIQVPEALCFLAGANSIFYGDKLLTTGNPDTQADLDLLERLGLKAGQPEAVAA